MFMKVYVTLIFKEIRVWIEPGAWCLQSLTYTITFNWQEMVWFEANSFESVRMVNPNRYFQGFTLITIVSD